MTVKIPHRITDITIGWLSELLPFPLTSFKVSKIDRGYMSDVYHLRLEPGNESIVIKIDSASGATKDLADRFRSYEKEHQFYAEQAELVTIRTPICYFNYYDQSGQFLLVLEDVGKQIKTHLNNSQITLAAHCLADLHSTPLTEGVPEFTDGMRAAEVDLKTADLENLYHDQVAELLSHYAKNSMELLPHFLNQPQVFSHMDFRLDNLGFTAEQVTLFDWGEFSTAPPGFDLAYFAVTSMTIEQRRSIEDIYLETYVKRNAASNKESILKNYQLCLLPAIYLPVFMAQVGNNNAAQQIAIRLNTAIEDHYEDIRGMIML